MKRRRVRFTETAQRHVDREHAWWAENRDHPEIFASELEDAVRIVALLPGIGNPYAEAGLPGLRRLYVRKLASHLYYTLDDDEVIVRALCSKPFGIKSLAPEAARHQCVGEIAVL